jgi:hypothetical protein
MRLVVCLLAAMMAVPLVASEFGDELEYPIRDDGRLMVPYYPQDLIDRHPALVANLVAQAQADPLNKVDGTTVYPYYPLLTAELTRMAMDYPDLVRLRSVGQSHLGLDIWMLEVADFNNPQAIPMADREVVYLDGGTHSNEYSGVYFVTEWLQFLLDEYETNETARWIVENRHTLVIPMVNPDGSNAFGRLNAITVNINRNFPGTWGTVPGDTPPLNWPGPYVASEPETQAVVDVILGARPDFVQSTHCCGNLWLHPYGAEHLGRAPDFDMYTNICETVFPDLTVDVERKQCGETWSTIYPAGGTTLDAGYALVGASSWSYEMSGRSEFGVGAWGEPVTRDDPRIQETESWRGVLHGFLNVEKYGALPTIVDVMGTTRQLTVTVENRGLGNITEGTLHFGGQAIALPGLQPNQQLIMSMPGDFSNGEVPVELDWKKREHPESNWGHTAFDVVLTGTDHLVGLLPAIASPPGMGDLLPAIPASVLANLSAPPPVEQLYSLPVASADRGSPGLPIVMLLAVLAGTLLARRRS